MSAGMGRKEAVAEARMRYGSGHIRDWYCKESCPSRVRLIGHARAGCLIRRDVGGTWTGDCWTMETVTLGRGNSWEAAFADATRRAAGSEESTATPRPVARKEGGAR